MTVSGRRSDSQSATSPPSGRNGTSASEPSACPSSTVTSSNPILLAAQRNSSSRRAPSSSSGVPSGLPASPRVATSSRVTRPASWARASAPAHAKLSSSGWASTAARPPIRSSGRYVMLALVLLVTEQRPAVGRHRAPHRTQHGQLGACHLRHEAGGARVIQERAGRRRVAAHVQPGEVVSVHPAPDPLEELVRVQQPGAEQVPVRLIDDALAFADESIGGLHEGPA